MERQIILRHHIANQPAHWLSSCLQLLGAPDCTVVSAYLYNPPAFHCFTPSAVLSLHSRNVSLRSLPWMLQGLAALYTKDAILYIYDLFFTLD